MGMSFACSCICSSLEPKTHRTAAEALPDTFGMKASNCGNSFWRTPRSTSIRKPLSCSLQPCTGKLQTLYSYSNTLSGASFGLSAKWSISTFADCYILERCLRLTHTMTPAIVRTKPVQHDRGPA